MWKACCWPALTWLPYPLPNERCQLELRVKRWSSWGRTRLPTEEILREHRRQKALKRLLHSGKTLGKEGRRCCPILARPQLPNKSFRTLPGGLQEGFLYNPDTGSSNSYVSNQFKATSPRGNPQNTTEMLFTKVARNVFLFQPVLQVAEKRKLKKGALRGAALKLGLALACDCPSWTQSLGALPSLRPAAGCLSPSHNGAASPSSRSPACRTPL